MKYCRYCHREIHRSYYFGCHPSCYPKQVKREQRKAAKEKEDEGR